MMHYSDALSYMNMGPLSSVGFFSLMGIVLIVVLALKGLALWYAAKRGEKIWFVAILIVNTLGILELVYLLAVAKVDVKNLLSKKSEGNSTT